MNIFEAKQILQSNGFNLIKKSKLMNEAEELDNSKLNKLADKIINMITIKFNNTASDIPDDEYFDDYATTAYIFSKNPQLVLELTVAISKIEMTGDKYEYIYTDRADCSNDKAYIVLPFGYVAYKDEAADAVNDIIKQSIINNYKYFLQFDEEYDDYLFELEFEDGKTYRS